MRRIVQVLMAGGVVAACLAAAGPAWASPKTVCSTRCPFTSIQAAINAASPGATITIGPGNYYENVVVNKSVTLQGSRNGTVIYPATSAPECATSSTLCGGAASTIILVEANNVTITKLWLKGDNPKLTSGVIRGGEEIDARNGIVENYSAGVYNDLTVSKVKVTGVYLRGIYASSEGTGFNFNHDTVENVQGEGESIAMFNFGGSGVMEDNTVTNTTGAFAANWSKGTQFVGNKISNTSSAIHTDNNGGKGGVADLIRGNKVQGCNENGYGIWVFAPYVSATVESNKIVGCYIGIAAFGSQVSGQGPTFSNNKVNGTGAKTTPGESTYGALLSTSLFEYGHGDLTTRLTGNSFEHFGTGMLAEQSAGGQATITASNNSFSADETGANGETGTVVEAQNNWWGCKKGPNQGGACVTAVGTVKFTPWRTAKH
jgi:hypothetical protein